MQRVAEHDEEVEVPLARRGTCDANHSCTFWGSWNDPIKNGPIKIRMTTRRTGPDTEFFEMYDPGRDGKEVKMSEMTYTRK